MGFARSKQAKEWCDTQGLKHSARFDWEHYGGHDNACALAQHFAERMDYLMTICLAKNDNAYRFKEEEVDAFKGTMPLETLLRPLEGRYLANAKAVCQRKPRMAG